MAGIRHEDGRIETVTLGAIAGHGPLLNLRARILADALDAALLGFGIAAAALATLRYAGARLKRGRRLRGGELVSAKQLRRRVLPPRLRLPRPLAPAHERPYRIAGIPWPDRAETRHTIVSGTTGSGKTVLIADLVEQIRARGERCVIYDKMGSYAETFFDPGRDVLLNPLDARAPRWSPFLEARDARDFDTMAAALIPRQKDTVDPFWITAARQLFSHGAAVSRCLHGRRRRLVLTPHALAAQSTTCARLSCRLVRRQSHKQPGCCWVECMLWGIRPNPLESVRSGQAVCRKNTEIFWTCSTCMLPAYGQIGVQRYGNHPVLRLKAAVS